MKLKQMVKWNLQNSYPSLLGFYGAMAFLYILAGMIVVFTGEKDVSFNGVALSATVMVFVMGLILFGVSLRFGLAHGVSRRTVFWGYLVNMVVFAAGIAVINFLFIGASRLLSDVPVDSSVMLFSLLWSYSTPVLSVLAMFVVMLCAGVFFGMVGFFIGGAYYRMGRVTKVVVSVGVPALLVFGIPLLVVAAPQPLLDGIGRFFAAIGSFIGASPYNLSAFLVLGAAVFAVLSWLLVRRAPAKTNF